MPIKDYYKGKGQKVMTKMKEEYGGAKAEEVFYATANKRGMKPDSSVKKAIKRTMSK